MNSKKDITQFISQSGSLKTNDVLDSKTEAMVAEFAAKKGITFDDALQELILDSLQGMSKESDEDTVTITKAEYESLKILARAGLDALEK